MRPTATVVVVNWNAGQLLVDCVKSLHDFIERTGWPLEIVVVDNGSTDGSLDLLRPWPAVQLIRNATNRGFAAACNQGARAGTADLILFFNPDCRLGPGSLEAAIQTLRSSADIGVVSVALRDDSGQVARSCHRFPGKHHLYARVFGLAQTLPSLFDSAMHDWSHAEDADVDHVIGAFYLLRRELFEKLGGFDERFFVYLEDLDLSLRIVQAGWRIRFLAQPATYHKGGGTSEKAKALRICLSTESRILYMFKHHGSFHGWLHLALSLTVDPIFRVVMLLARRRWTEIPEVGAAMRQLWGRLPQTLRRRHGLSAS